jgi:hypothetical protein
MQQLQHRWAIFTNTPDGRVLIEFVDKQILVKSTKFGACFCTLLGAVRWIKAKN